jgi:hypothetical protein
MIRRSTSSYSAFGMAASCGSSAIPQTAIAAEGRAHSVTEPSRNSRLLPSFISRSRSSPRSPDLFRRIFSHGDAPCGTRPTGSGSMSVIAWLRQSRRVRPIERVRLISPFRVQPVVFNVRFSDNLRDRNKARATTPTGTKVTSAKSRCIVPSGRIGAIRCIM